MSNFEALLLTVISFLLVALFFVVIDWKDPPTILYIILWFVVGGLLAGARSNHRK